MNSHARFDSRASAYVRGRPGYPPALVDRLAAIQDWRPGRVLADVGAGTGIFTRSILERGPRVIAIEPSAPMRREAEGELGRFPGFSSVAATAAATSLPDASVDGITCAQAFHWFNREETRTEWRRILRPGSQVALVWNFLDQAEPAGGAFFELLVASGPSAGDVIATAMATARENVLFAAGAAERWEVPHEQPLDWSGLVERTHSTSYLPKQGESGYEPMMAALERFFARFASEGRVLLPLRAVATCGPLAP